MESTLDMLDKLPKLVSRAVGLTFAASPKPFSHFQIVAGLSVF